MILLASALEANLENPITKTAFGGDWQQVEQENNYPQENPMKSWGLELVSDCVRITHLKDGANASLWKD